MSDQPSPQSLRTEAIETLLIEKKLLTSADVDTVLTTFSEQVGPMNGAKLVARAWVDEGFKARLLEDATTIIAEHGFEGGQVDKLIVKACSESVHHVVVCTPVFLLSLGGPWLAPTLVQGPRVSLKDRS